MADEVYAKNTISGVVAMVPAHYLEHPILGEHLVEVRNGKSRKSLKDLVVDIAKADEGESAEPDKKEDD